MLMANFGADPACQGYLAFTSDALPAVLRLPVAGGAQVAVMERDTGLKLLSDEEVDALVKEIEEEKAAAEAAKRGGQQAGGSGQA